MPYHHNQLNSFLRANKREQGVVIIVALFIVALVAAMAYSMMARLSRDTRQTTMLVNNVQGGLIAQGSIAWAQDQLRNNIKNKKPDKLVDPIPIASPEQDVNGFMVKSTIYDLQSRFNLNNLKDQKAQQQFMRLLQLLVPGLSRDKIKAINMAVVDWITPQSQQNTLSRYYLSLPTPYRAAHRPMLNASELRLVKGVTSEIYQVLHPYIVALPTMTKVNMQTASAPVLASLSERVTLQDANAIVQLQKKKPLNANPSSYNIEVIKDGRFPLSDVVMVSDYFLIETQAAIDEQRILIYTLVKREQNSGQADVKILIQSKGSW